MISETDKEMMLLLHGWTCSILHYPPATEENKKHYIVGNKYWKNQVSNDIVDITKRWLSTDDAYEFVKFKD